MASISREPFVSVCIPARNGAALLPHTLANLLRHSTYPKHLVEILVGDHGSDDDTIGVLARWPAVRRVAVPYAGPNRACVRNALLAEAKGELALFLDHDVLASEELIAEHVRVHQRFPNALVAGQTFGKDFINHAELASLMSQLELDHIDLSHHELHTNSQLGDPRTSPTLLGSRPEEICEVGREPAPWRYCWTCNLSAPMALLRECGGFDENYDGWGAEDDALAVQFVKRNATLLFSKKAWAFHVPHEMDVPFNLVNWQRNSRLLFRDYPTRSFEYYLQDGLHGCELPGTIVRMERALERLLTIPIQETARQSGMRLGPAQGRRLAWLMPDVPTAQSLHATDAFVPYVGINAPGWTELGIRCWSLFGLSSHFDQQQIDESVVIADTLMLLDRHLALQVLAELARVSRRVVIACGTASCSSRYERGYEMVEAVAGRLRFAEVVTIGGPNRPA